MLVNAYHVKKGGAKTLLSQKYHINDMPDQRGYEGYEGELMNSFMRDAKTAAERQYQDSFMVGAINPEAFQAEVVQFQIIP